MRKQTLAKRHLWPNGVESTHATTPVLHVFFGRHPVRCTTMHGDARRCTTGWASCFLPCSIRTASSRCIRAKQQSRTLRYLPSRCLRSKSQLQGDSLAKGRHEMRPAWLVARFQLPALPPSLGHVGCEDDLFDRSRCEQSMLSCHLSMPSSCSQV